MGGQMDADQMSLWMMLKESTGGGNNNPQMPPMHNSWMSSHNNNNNSVNKSRPPPFMPNPEPDLHLQDPYNVSEGKREGGRVEEILMCVHFSSKWSTWECTNNSSRSCRPTSCRSRTRTCSRHRDLEVVRRCRTRVPNNGAILMISM